MSSRSTNNSMQSVFQELLSSAESLPQLSIPSIAPTALSSSTPGQVVASSGAAIFPDMVALITQTVQAALAAEWAKDPPSGPIVSSPSSTLSSSAPLVGAIGGVPSFSALGSVPSSVSLPGPSSSGRPFSSFVVPVFISTFTTPVMSISSSAMSAASSLFEASHDVAMAGTVQPSPIIDQPFVIGPGFSLVPVKLVSQIVAGKYIDLSELLPANLQLKEPEPQLMLDGLLVPSLVVFPGSVGVHLHHAAKVVWSGCTFLPRMIDLLYCLRCRDHPICLNSEFHLDLQWWHEFLSSWHGVSFWLYPGMSAASDLEVTSDAAGSLGFGAYFKGEWFSGAWAPCQSEQSIAYKELFPVIIASHIWGP